MLLTLNLTLLEPFSEGLARVKIGDRYGYINKQGQYVINLLFDFAEVFFRRFGACEQIGEGRGLSTRKDNLLSRHHLNHLNMALLGGLFQKVWRVCG